MRREAEHLVLSSLGAIAVTCRSASRICPAAIECRPDRNDHADMCIVGHLDTSHEVSKSIWSRSPDLP